MGEVVGVKTLLLHLKEKAAIKSYSVVLISDYARHPSD